MNIVLFAALLAAAPAPAPTDAPAADALDRRCFGLMVELAGEDDPRIRSLGRTAAQYFLGRIDAASPDFDPEDSATTDPAPAGLLRRCGDAMQAGGHDFRAIGRALAAPPRPTT